MTTISKCLFEAQAAPNTETTVYTAPAGTRTILDKITATNTSGGNITVTWKIIPSGGTPAASNAVTYQKTVATGGPAETFPEMVGQVLNAGDFLSVLASAATGLTIRGSGREMT
jgi:hypothetical protein